MTTTRSIHQETTDALAALIRQQAYVATFCATCGKTGDARADDHVTLICARCWIVAHGGTPNDAR